MQFPTNDSAFSAVALFQTFGFIVGFVASSYLCVIQKTYIYMGLAFLSLVTYIILLVKNSFIQKHKTNKKILDTKVEAAKTLEERVSLFVDEKSDSIPMKSQYYST